MSGPALGSQQPHAMLRAWGRVAGKLPGRKRPWAVGWQPAGHEPAVCPGGQEGQQHPGFYQEQCGQQEQGGNRVPVLGTGEAAPWVLCWVLGPSIQEGPWVAEAHPEKSNRAGEGSREQVLRGAADSVILRFYDLERFDVIFAHQCIADSSCTIKFVSEIYEINLCCLLEILFAHANSSTNQQSYVLARIF